MQNDYEEYSITYKYLIGKYDRAMIGKRELAYEMGISLSTLDLYMARGYGLPQYKKLGNKANSRVVFNLVDVAKFLSCGMQKTI